MQRGSTLWVAYPLDSPGPIDFDSPAGKPFWVNKFIWKRTTERPVQAGSVLHITDADDNEVLNEVWPEDIGAEVTEICRERCSYFRGMKFEAFDDGVLEIVVS